MISTAEYKDSEEETTIDSSYGMGFGDSDYEGSSTGTETDDDVTKNYWFAREDVIVIDSKLESTLRQYPYGEGLEELRKQGLLNITNEMDTEDESFQKVIACTGRTIRHGTREQRGTLLAIIRQFLGAYRSSASNASTFLFQHQHHRPPHVQRTRAAGPDTNNENANSNLGKYASTLKEYGDQRAWLPEYITSRVSEVPPWFQATVKCENFTFEGEARNKKEARHRAAEKACRFFKLSAQ